MKSMIQVGTDGKGIKAAKSEIVSLLATFPREALNSQVATEALITLRTLCQVNHTIISNCTLTYKQAAKKGKK